MATPSFLYVAELAADQDAVFGNLGRIVAARDIRLDVGEAMLVEMRAEFLLGLGARLVGDETEVELRDGAAGQHGLAAGTGIARDEPFDIDRRFLREADQRIVIGEIVDPVGDAERRLLLRLVARLRGFADQRLFALGERADILEPALDRGRVAALGHERLKRLHQPPGGRVDHRLQAGVHVALRAAAPFLAARDQFEFDDALRSQIDRHVAGLALATRRG